VANVRFADRNIDPRLKRRLVASARSHGRSLSEEARMLLKKALLEPPPEKRRMGTVLLELVPENTGAMISFLKFRAI
jgi:plasmid stability protein